MYKTTWRSALADSMSGHMVASTRLIHPFLEADAVSITSCYAAVHWAPVHIGSPERLGIKDLGNSDFDDAV